MLKTLLSAALLLVAVQGRVAAQCMEIEEPVALSITVTVPEIIGQGVSQKFFYPVQNPHIMDEVLTITLRRLSGPADWAHQFCEDPEADPPGFCRPIQPWEGGEFTITDVVFSEQVTLYDAEFFARSFGTSQMEIILVRDFCPDDTIRNVLTFTLEEGTGLPAQPAGLELLPPWPNPFNPLTHIPFHLDSPGAVRVEIIDLAGRLVAVPLAGSLPAGRHEALFDGAGLPSGRYQARVVTERSVLSTPLTLIK
ncbi:MAG: hypothetical protein Q8O14_09615 [bacterium]|nr:hypothetical protein [bacterium]